MKNNHYPKPEVGMEVYVVPSNEFLKPTVLKITKVGRKWITLEKYNGRSWRFDIETWRLDGGEYSSPGTCYPSEQEYLAQQELSKAWAKLSNNFRHHYPMNPEVTLEKIQQAAELLGIKLLEDK